VKVETPQDGEWAVSYCTKLRDDARTSAKSEEVWGFILGPVGLISAGIGTGVAAKASGTTDGDRERHLNDGRETRSEVVARHVHDRIGLEIGPEALLQDLLAPARSFVGGRPDALAVRELYEALVSCSFRREVDPRPLRRRGRGYRGSARTSPLASTPGRTRSRGWSGSPALVMPIAAQPCWNAAATDSPSPRPP